MGIWPDKEWLFWVGQGTNVVLFNIKEPQVMGKYGVNSKVDLPTKERIGKHSMGIVYENSSPSL